MVELEIERSGNYNALVRALRESKELHDNEEWDDDKGYMYHSGEHVDVEASYGGSKGYVGFASVSIDLHTDDAEVESNAKDVVRDAAREAGAGSGTFDWSGPDMYEYRIDFE